MKLIWNAGHNILTTQIYALYGAISCEKLPVHKYHKKLIKNLFRLHAHQRLIVANGGKPIKMVSVWSSGLTNGLPCLSNKNFAVQGERPKSF